MKSSAQKAAAHRPPPPPPPTAPSQVYQKMTPRSKLTILRTWVDRETELKDNKAVLGWYVEMVALVRMEHTELSLEYAKQMWELGEFYLRNGEPTKALDCALDASAVNQTLTETEIGPGLSVHERFHPQLLLTVGQCLLACGRVAQAMTVLQRALRLNIDVNPLEVPEEDGGLRAARNEVIAGAFCAQLARAMSKADGRAGTGTVAVAPETVRELASRALRLLSFDPLAVDEVEVMLLAARHLGDLGRLFAVLSEDEKAEAAARRAVAVMDDVYGADSIYHALYTADHGDLRETRGDLTGALELYKAAYRVHEAILGTHSHRTIALHRKVAHILVRQQRFQEAVRPLVDILKREVSLYGKHSPQVAETLALMGTVHYGLRDFEKADRLYQEALRIEVTEHGADHPRARAVADKIKMVAKHLVREQLREGDGVPVVAGFSRDRDRIVYDGPRAITALDTSSFMAFPASPIAPAAAAPGGGSIRQPQIPSMGGSPPRLASTPARPPLSAARERVKASDLFPFCEPRPEDEVENKSKKSKSEAEPQKGTAAAAKTPRTAPKPSGTGFGTSSRF
jgi:tetratricopeptide (TPR) repeat protein